MAMALLCGLGKLSFISGVFRSNNISTLYLGKQSKRKKRKALAVGPLELWNVCNRLVKDDLNIDTWKV